MNRNVKNVRILLAPLNLRLMCTPRYIGDYRGFDGVIPDSHHVRTVLNSVDHAEQWSHHGAITGYSSVLLKVVNSRSEKRITPF